MSMYSIYNILSGGAIGFLIGLRIMWRMQKDHKAAIEDIAKQNRRAIDQMMQEMKERIKKD